jgi:molybdopterin/thiamine biosynthesis adenylyltransferase/molybdopterin synthase catalytic subunit/rhodanese-related sulfurtransferase
MKLFSFSHAAIDPRSLRVELEDPAAGGYAAFEGWVRNHNEGQAVTRLEYEAFESLAIKEGERIVREAIERFDVLKAACVHRVGSLAIGDLAVWVGVSARHRAEAFAACRYIIDEVKHRVPIWKKEHYVNGDSGWVNCERCAEHAHEHWHAHAGTGHWALGSGQNAPRDAHAGSAHLDSTDHATCAAAPALTGARRPEPSARADYSRQILLREVGEAGQAKLRSARVLVIGAGGLGVPVLTYLAGAGVGTIGIVDSDALDASNLHRQTLYSLADVGRPKAPLAAERLRALNPDVEVRAIVERFTAENAVRLLEDYDLVVECTDNFATKFLVNDAALAARKPAIFASVYQYEGQLLVYRAQDDSACLRCIWPEATRDGLVGNCAEAGVLGPVPGVFGTLQALEALKVLLGLPGLTNQMLLIDLMTLEQRKLRTQRRAECNHQPRIEPKRDHTDLEVTFPELRLAVNAGFKVIDIREPEEVRSQPISQTPSLHIPMAQLLANDDGLTRDERYLLVCARGARSRAAAEHLRERGFPNAYSLKGGLAAIGPALASMRGG